jgi:hypothetical protein
MPKQRGAIVAVTPDAAKFLQSVGFISKKIHKKDNQHFILCSRIKESPNFLDLILIHESPSEIAFSISLPYRFVQYILAGQNIEQALGFHSEK